MKGLKSRAQLFPVFALNLSAVNAQMQEAVRLGGWAAAQGVYHLDEYL